jgi:tRNA G10  N-methylase Trm11
MTAIYYLHNHGQPIELDPMYCEGRIHVPGMSPKLKFDKFPRDSNIQAADARSLPIQDSGVRSIILDPPWLIDSEASYSLAQKYTAFPNRNSLISTTQDIIKESSRVLAKNGLLVLKTQDVTHNRVKIFLSIILVNYAISIGLKPIDHFVLLSKNRIRNNTMGLVHHSSHSYHCHFYVFRKSGQVANYSHHISS